MERLKHKRELEIREKKIESRLMYSKGKDAVKKLHAQRKREKLEMKKIEDKEEYEVDPRSYIGKFNKEKPEEVHGIKVTLELLN